MCSFNQVLRPSADNPILVEEGSLEVSLKGSRYLQEGRAYLGEGKEDAKVRCVSEKAVCFVVGSELIQLIAHQSKIFIPKIKRMMNASESASILDSPIKDDIKSLNESKVTKKHFGHHSVTFESKVTK